MLNTFGFRTIYKQSNRSDEIFLFCSKVDLYIQKCWKIIISNSKLLQRINPSHNISMYFITHRKSGVALISEKRYRSIWVLSVLVLKVKASEPVGIAKRDWTCSFIMYITYTLIFHCSFCLGRDDWVLQTEFPHYQTAKNLQWDTVYLFLYSMVVLVIFNKSSGLWDLYEL